MTSTAKLLGLYSLLGLGLVFLGVPGFVAGAVAVGATLLTQLIINTLRPKNPQEETMRNLGFTGLSLGARPKNKDADKSAQS